MHGLATYWRTNNIGNQTTIKMYKYLIRHI